MARVELAIDIPKIIDDDELMTAEEKQMHLRPRRYPLPPSNRPEYPWPAPKEEDLTTEDFNRVWDAIKSWDINVPYAYGGYCSATGNHVMEILFALDRRNIQDYNPSLIRNQEVKVEQNDFTRAENS